MPGATVVAAVNVTKPVPPGARNCDESVGVIPVSPGDTLRPTRLVKVPVPPAWMLAEPRSPAMILRRDGSVGKAVRAKSPVVVTVNGALAVPFDVVTRSGPVVAPGGTDVVIDVGE